jgi:hypothetical protein
LKKGHALDLKSPLLNGRQSCGFFAETAKSRVHYIALSAARISMVLGAHGGDCGPHGHVGQSRVGGAFCAQKELLFRSDLTNVDPI